MEDEDNTVFDSEEIDYNTEKKSTKKDKELNLHDNTADDHKLLN